MQMQMQMQEERKNLKPKEFISGQGADKEVDAVYVRYAAAYARGISNSLAAVVIKR